MQVEGQGYAALRHHRLGYRDALSGSVRGWFGLRGHGFILELGNEFEKDFLEVILVHVENLNEIIDGAQADGKRPA